MKLFLYAFLLVFMVGCEKNPISGLFLDNSDSDESEEIPSGFAQLTKSTIGSISVTPYDISLNSLDTSTDKIILKDPGNGPISGSSVNYHLDVDTGSFKKLTWDTIIGSTLDPVVHYSPVSNKSIHILTGGTFINTLMYVYDYSTKTFSNLVPNIDPTGLKFINLSDDGSKVIFSTSEGLFWVDTTTKVITTLITNSNNEVYTYASFTHDYQKIVFFAVRLTTNNNLFVIDVDGSNLVQLSNFTESSIFASVEAYKIAPDNSTVVYFGQVNSWPGVDELYRVDIDGTNNMRVHASLVGTGKDVMSDIYIAPDSSFFVYAGDITTDNIIEVYAADIDGSNVRTLNATTNASRDARVSTEEIFIADDSSLVYFNGDFTIDERDDWYSSTPDGVTVTNLTNFPNVSSTISNNVFTSNGLTLISTRNVSGEIRLFSTNLNTQVSTDITGSLVSGGDVRSASYIEYTQLSLDETEVIYMGDLIVDARIDIYKTPIGGGTRTTLLTDVGGTYFTLSNDGTRVISYKSECRSVLLSDGSGAIEYANLGTGELLTDCVYLRASDKILVGKSLPNGSADLKVYNLDGTLDLSLTPPRFNSFIKRAMKVSPDQTKIAYLVDGYVYTANMDGSNPIQVSQLPIVNANGLSTYSTLTEIDQMFSFSPDGEYIHYLGLNIVTFTTDIFSVRTDGSAHTALTTGATFNNISGFKYSPDGTKIAILDQQFSNEYNGGRLIHVSDLDGSNYTQVAQDYTDPSRYISLSSGNDPYFFTADNQYIVYVSRGTWCCSSPVSVKNLYASKPDGSDFKTIGDDSLGNSSDLLIASTGSTVYYAQGGVLNAVDVATNVKTPLSAICEMKTAIEIPSRGLLACIKNGELRLIPTDGSAHSSVHTEEALYTLTATDPGKIKLSSDGKYLVYYAPLASPSTSYKVFSYDLDSGDNTTLSPSLWLTSLQFELIPNSSSIVFSGYSIDSNQGILRKIDLDGTDEFEIENNLGGLLLTNHFHFDVTENYIVYPTIDYPFSGVKVKISTLNGDVKEYLNDGNTVVFFDMYGEDKILYATEVGSSSEVHYTLKQATIRNPTPDPE